jgi:hypothetical protein
VRAKEGVGNAAGQAREEQKEGICGENIVMVILSRR